MADANSDKPRQVDGPAPQAGRPVRRLLVVIPNWVGDVVLATPVLAALRARFRQTHIAFLMRRYVAEVVEGGGWHDAAVFWPNSSGLVRQGAMLRLVLQLRRACFDTALLFTNSFRSALVIWLARIPRRVGYSREARGWMLTDRLRPLRKQGELVPTPVLPYYAALAGRLGCVVADRKLRLGITPAQERAGRELLHHYGLDDGRPYALINPGTAFGAAKCWPVERFAELCARLQTELGLRPVLVGAPHEAGLLRTIAAMAASAVVCCDSPGTTLGSLKVLVREAALLVCNDTGPRHYGNAFDVPTVTLFGPTHQEWTDTGYDGEVKLQVPVECGPCQLKTCPLDHRCMTGLTTDMVMHAAGKLLARRAARDQTQSWACGRTA